MSSIIWKGISSDCIKGLIISKLPPISKPKMRIKTTEIDGLDGDIIDELGYSAYDKTIEIGLSYNYNIDEIIKYFSGEGDLILSNEDDKYYKAKILSRIDYNSLIRFKTAKVVYHCQPFKHKVHEAKISKEITNETEIKIHNIGLEMSKPIITLYGTGILHFYLNANEIFIYNFDDEQQVVIDSELQEAYLDNTLKNRNMLGEFPIFVPGENVISWAGNLTKIEIQPKSRWL